MKKRDIDLLNCRVTSVGHVIKWSGGHGVHGSFASGDIYFILHVQEPHKTTSLRGHANLWVGAPRGTSPP